MSFSYFLDLGARSTACVNALCTYDLGCFVVQDEYGGRVVLAGSDGVYDSTPGPALDCLNSEAREREVRYHGKARLYEPGARPAFRPPDGLRVNCSEFSVAARLNTVLWRRLGVTDRTFTVFAGAVEAAPHFEIGEVYVSLRCHGAILAESVGWRKSTGRNLRTSYPGLPDLPALLAAHSPATDKDFWGRVRAMIVVAMDEAGLFSGES